MKYLQLATGLKKDGKQLNNCVVCDGVVYTARKQPYDPKNGYLGGFYFQKTHRATEKQIQNMIDAGLAEIVSIGESVKIAFVSKGKVLTKSMKIG